MANNRLNYAIVLQLVTEGLRKGSAQAISQFRKMQMGLMSFTAALGAGTIGLSNFVSKLIQTAKETSRVNIALKNVSGSAEAFADNQRFLLGLSKKYGVEINGLTSGFTKFKAAADISNMSMEDQRKIFESVSRAAVAFGMSTEDQQGVFLALSQMMSKNKVMAEELRLQMAERMPVAIQAMAKAAGVSVGELDNMMKAGKVMAADVLPKFADALNEMIPNIDTDNLNKSLTDLTNTFTQLTKNLDVEGKFKGLIDTVNSALSWLAEHTKAVFDMMWGALILGSSKFGNSLIGWFVTSQRKSQESANRIVAAYRSAQKRIRAEIAGTEKYQKAVDAAARARSKMTTQVQLQHLASMTKGWKSFSYSVRANIAAIGASLKAMAMANVWTAALSAIIGLVTWISKAVGHAREMRNLMGDTAKRINALSADQKKQISDLEYYSGLLAHNEKDVRVGALEKINELLGTQYKYADLYNKAGQINETIQGQINEVIRNRIKLIQLEAKAQNIANEKENLRKKIDELSGKAKYRTKTEVEIEYFDARTKKKITEFTSNPNQYYAAKRTGRMRSQSVPTNAAAKDLEKYQKAYSRLLIEDTDNIEEHARIVGKQNILDKKNDNNQQDENDEKDLAKRLQRLNREAESLLSSAGSLDEFEDIVADAAEKSKKRLAKNEERQRSEFATRFFQENKDLFDKGLKRDRTSDWKLSDEDILAADLDEAKKYFDALSQYADKTGADLSSELGKALQNVTSLSDAYKIAEFKKDIDDVQKQLRSGMYNAVTTTGDAIIGAVDSFERLSETMSDSDASGWEKIVALWETLTSLTDGIMKVVEVIEELTAVKELFTKAQKVQAAQESMDVQKQIASKTALMSADAAETTSEVTNAETKIAADQGEAAAAAGSSAAKGLPWPWNLIAIGGAIAAAIAAFATIPKFEKGGIVGGNSKRGDKLLARVNSGERIITEQGWNNISEALSGESARTTQVEVTGEVKVRGRDLAIVLEKYDKYKKRTK